jgi:hypothetical protein
MIKMKNGVTSAAPQIYQHIDFDNPESPVPRVYEKREGFSIEISEDEDILIATFFFKFWLI